MTHANDPKPLGWGLVGAAWIAQAFMIPAMRANSDSEPVAVLSSDPSRGRSFAEENDIPRVHDSLEAMLADPAVDVIYVSTTNELHKPPTIAAAAAGKAVLCEKPLALTLSDAIEMVAACREAGVVFGTNHHMRNAPAHRTIRRLISEGAIGRPLAARIAIAVYLGEDLRTWRVHAPEKGGGAIFDLTVHSADMLRFLLDDEVEDVMAISAQQGLASGNVEDAAMGVMTFPGGILASFHDAYTVRHGLTGLEIHGTEGSIVATDVLTSITKGDVELRRGDAAETVHTGEYEEQYARAVRRFSEAVRGEGRPAATGEDGVRSLAVALAVRESAQTGKRVTVDYPGGGLQGPAI